MKFITIIGRILYSFIFIGTIATHFSSGTIQHATAAGVPFPSVSVPLAAIIATLGGLSILLGYKAKVGSWLIVLFLIPVTLYMHRFWNVPDPGMQAMQKINFMKNISLLGAALIISQLGSGPGSIDRIERKKGLTKSMPMEKMSH